MLGGSDKRLQYTLLESPPVIIFILIGKFDSYEISNKDVVNHQGKSKQIISSKICPQNCNG